MLKSQSRGKFGSRSKTVPSPSYDKEFDAQTTRKPKTLVLFVALRENAFYKTSDTRKIEGTRALGICFLYMYTQGSRNLIQTVACIPPLPLFD